MFSFSNYLKTDLSGIVRALLPDGCRCLGHHVEINLETRVRFTLFCLHQGLVVVRATKRFITPVRMLLNMEEHAP